MGRDSPARIGVVSEPGREVYLRVADRLRERGHAVEFVAPYGPVDRDWIDGLDLLVNKKTNPVAVRALQYAEGAGVRTWNGALPTVLFGSRLNAVRGLAAVGFRTPATTLDRPGAPYVAKPLFSWEGDPVVGGEGGLYQPLLDRTGPDCKYYVVDDGAAVHATHLRCRSKLDGGKRLLGEAPVDQSVVDRIQDLMGLTGASAMGVDLVPVDGDRYAVDVNVTASFSGTGLEAALADSMEAALGR